MTAQAIPEKRYYVIGCCLYEAEFVSGYNSFFRKPETEKLISKHENTEIAIRVYKELLKESGFIHAHRPALAVGAF